MSKLQSIAVARRVGRPQLMYGQSWFKRKFPWLTVKQAANLSVHFSYRWPLMSLDARKVILNTYRRSPTMQRGPEIERRAV